MSKTTSRLCTIKLWCLLNHRHEGDCEGLMRQTICAYGVCVETVRAKGETLCPEHYAEEQVVIGGDGSC